MNPLVIISKHSDGEDEECCNDGDGDTIFGAGVGSSTPLNTNDHHHLLERGRSSSSSSSFKRKSSSVKHKIEANSNNNSNNQHQQHHFHSFLGSSKSKKSLNELPTPVIVPTSKDEENCYGQREEALKACAVSVASFYSDIGNNSSSSIGSADSILFFQESQEKLDNKLRSATASSPSNKKDDENDKTTPKTSKVKQPPRRIAKISKLSRGLSKKNRASKCNKFILKADSSQSQSQSIKSQEEEEPTAIVKLNDDSSSNFKSIKKRLLSNFRRLTSDHQTKKAQPPPPPVAKTAATALSPWQSSGASSLASSSLNVKGTYETLSSPTAQAIKICPNNPPPLSVQSSASFLSFFRSISTNSTAAKTKTSYAASSSLDTAANDSTLHLNHHSSSRLVIIDSNKDHHHHHSGDTKYIKNRHQSSSSSSKNQHHLILAPSHSRYQNAKEMSCIGSSHQSKTGGDFDIADDRARANELLKPPPPSSSTDSGRGGNLHRNISRSFNSLITGVRKSLLLKSPRSASSAATRPRDQSEPIATTATSSGQLFDQSASLDKPDKLNRRAKTTKEERKLVKSQTFQENKGGRRLRTLFLKSSSTSKKSRDELSSYYINAAAAADDQTKNENGGKEQQEQQFDVATADKSGQENSGNKIMLEGAAESTEKEPPADFMAESSSKQQMPNGKSVKSPLLKTKNRHSITAQKSIDQPDTNELTARLDRQDTIVGSTVSNQHDDDTKLMINPSLIDANGLLKSSRQQSVGGDTTLLDVKLHHQDSKSSATASQLAPVLESSTTSSSDKLVCYELRVRLKEGKNLAVRDLCGTSDPYVKFQLNGSSVFKSKIVLKNLNPVWNEEFVLKLTPSLIKEITFADDKQNQQRHMSESTSLISWTQAKTSFNESYLTSAQLEFFLSKFKLKMFVYDYDRGFLNDDLIGYANIDLSLLKENVEIPFEVELEDEKLNKYEYLGLVLLDITLVPRYLKDERDAALSKQQGTSATATAASSSRTRRVGATQQWQSVLNVVLLEGNDLISMDDNGFSDPYVKFKLENERYRSRTIKRTLNPKFLEQFQLYVYDNAKMTLHLAVYDYDTGSGTDDFMGKTSIDLRSLETEKTHFLRLPLEDGAGTISLLVTITATYGPDSVTDIEYNKESTAATSRYFDNIIRKYGLLNSLKNIDDVGWLQVKVLRAEGLASADMNGKSDPFCSLQLINQYVQTHTEYKTLNPEWGKLFEFNVTDIHAVLEVNVLDEDKNKVVEFLGKVEIPIIQIQNGKRRFYALKDKKLVRRAKGAIELEMNMIYNPLKAVVKTFNPREEKYLPPEPKLKIPILKQNIMRVHNVVQGVLNTGSFIDSCFRWVHPIRSIISFIAFIILVLNFELYMLPLSILMIFLKNYIIIKLKAAGTSLNTSSIDDDDSINFDFIDEEDDATTGDAESKEPKKSFREKLNEIQEICLKVQETLDYIASLGERIINTFTFTVPWLSWLAIVVLLVASFILYMIPLRYLLLIWGINKFTKKFRKPPNYVDNTEILDFLSRVPSKKEVFQYRELRVEKTSAASTAQLNSQTSVTVSKDKKKKKA